MSNGRQVATATPPRHAAHGLGERSLTNTRYPLRAMRLMKVMVWPSGDRGGGMLQSGVGGYGLGSQVTQVVGK